MRTATLGLLVSLATLSACADDATTPESERSVVVDKREEQVTTFREHLTCDFLIGMNVCSIEYVGAMYQCGYAACMEMCLQNPEVAGLGICQDLAQQCGTNYAVGATNQCGYLNQEWWLCDEGYADPATCVGMGGGGGGGHHDDDAPWTESGETCTWCSCTSNTWSFEGEVCGSSTQELVDTCWSRC